MTTTTYDYIYCHPITSAEDVQILQAQHQMSAEACMHIQFIRHDGINWPPCWMDLDPGTGLLTVGFLYYAKQSLSELLLVKGTRRTM